MPDSDFILKQWRDTITEFKNDYDKWEKHTMKDYIMKCKELLEAQIEREIISIDTSGISSYLYSQLNKEGIEVTDRYIQKVLPDYCKRNKSLTEQCTDIEESKFKEIVTSDDNIKLEKSQFNEIKINGVEYKPIKTPEPKQPKENIQHKEKTTRQYVFLNAMSRLTNKFHLTLESLKDRYNEDEEVQKIIDSELGDVEKKLQDYAQLWASIENSKGMIDLRRDWGEYEKTVAAFLMETGETIAKIAQLMDYSEKYGSIGILREPQVISFFENETNFPLYLRRCPKCLDDISVTMNRNISYYRECQRLGVEFKPMYIEIPTIKYNQ